MVRRLPAVSYFSFETLICIPFRSLCVALRKEQGGRRWLSTWSDIVGMFLFRNKWYFFISYFYQKYNREGKTL